MGKTKNTRRFNYDGPIAYQGSLYPSTQMDIEDDKGNVSSRNVFADASGQYYTLNEDGNAIPIVLQNNLDEVTVTAPRNRRNTFNDYLTMSNDATKVFNTPHREYNPHLREAAVRGAESHALWEREHPNATAWGNALASVPFAVAAAPFAVGIGDAMAGSAIGQYIGNGLNMIANAASNSSWLPWADTLASSYFAAHGLQDIANGNFTPETAMEVMPLAQVAKPMYKMGRNSGLRNIRKETSVTKEAPIDEFKSELDWTPENWFGTRTGNIGYDAEDITALRSHIPEYHQIEKQAKADGTWLKMPDGSTWEGDPRSWVQIMSKNGRKLQPRIMYHGDDDFYLDIGGEDITPEILGSKILWTSTNKHLPATYGSNHYQLTIPKETPNIVFDADGRFWNNLSAPSSYKYHNTNDVSLDLLKDDNTVNINNVVDVGADSRWKAGEKGIPNSLPAEKLYDYYDRVFKGDDIILGKDVPRKSLLGNNGDFDLLKKNIYKGIVPFVLGNFIPNDD